MIKSRFYEQAENFLNKRSRQKNNLVITRDDAISGLCDFVESILLDMKTNSADNMEEIEFLKNRILNNTAVLEDYIRYEEILIVNGINRDEIYNILRKHDISSFDELLRIRNIKMESHKDYDKRKTIETEVVVSLVLLIVALNMKINKN